MAHSTLMIAIDWYGPFPSLESAGAEARNTGTTEGIYLAVKDSTRQAYVGTSGDLFHRLNERHHVLGGLESGEADIWVGVLASQLVPGRNARPYMRSTPIVVAEKAMAFFLRLSENKRLRSRPPDDSFILMNRWFNGTDPYERRGRGHKKWPDMIEYDKESKQAQLVWFCGKQTILDTGDVERLKA